MSKGWQVVFRKCYLNKNTQFGLSVSYDGTPNQVDLGTTGSLGGHAQ